MTVFHLRGEPEAIVNRLFHADEGHLRFGSAGRTTTPASLVQVWGDGVEIRDYIMEGFVKYRIRAEKTTDGVQLEVQKFGTNRDQHVDSSVKHYIRSLGFEVK